MITSEKIDCVKVMLTLNLTQQEYAKSEKLQDKIEEFTTCINDRLCDKFKDDLMFDGCFTDATTYSFTIDSCNENVRKEINKTIDKLLQNKKFSILNNRKKQNEEELIN